MLAYFVNCKLDISTEFNTFSNLTGINKTILLTDTSVGNSLLYITLTHALCVWWRYYLYHCILYVLDYFFLKYNTYCCHVSTTAATAAAHTPAAVAPERGSSIRVPRDLDRSHRYPPKNKQTNK